MRLFLVPAFTAAALLLGGCASAPNEPTLTLQTSKAPDEYVQCVVPKLQEEALTPTLSQSQRHYKIVVSSAIAADNVIEAYKAPTGGKVFLYERQLLTASFMPSRFERVAQECL
ncbi:hypothetical protein [Pseudomonas sp. NPDC089734]|uniref:hypothetical protein n=1 Tax=Pseudomonas sp. NPDC089734 TaxID=3364469 RepID=UPI0037F1417C